MLSCDNTVQNEDIVGTLYPICIYKTCPRINGSRFPTLQGQGPTGTMTSASSGRPASSASLRATHSSLATKLSSSQLLDPKGELQIYPTTTSSPPLAASHVGLAASPSQPALAGAGGMQAGLPSHLWAALEQRWTEGQETEGGHQGVLLSVDDEMVRSKPCRRSVVTIPCFYNIQRHVGTQECQNGFNN